jgi:DTW domain-containing protein YfiP
MSIRSLNDNTNYLLRQAVLTQTYLTVEALLSMLENFQAAENAYDQQFELTKDLSEIGHLSESLLSEDKLKEILRVIGSPLTSFYAY